ncbi:glycoside hydrolase superfamily [Sporodiniella umbellata]|nr:glycoside hydrolase superfamily [Sporodiniella umbellata]
MKFSITFAILATFFAASEAKTLLFPIPQNITWTGAQATLSSNFRITGAKNSHVKEAADRYQKLISKERWVPVQVTAQQNLTQGGSLNELSITIQDNSVKLDINVDESYTLSVPSKGGKITLKAPTWVGALRGLETFSQLVQEDRKSLVVHTAEIQDAPSFTHRGILLDTSRNFYPIASLKRTIDAMSYNKMNVLHWHVTDSQSWPLFIKSHPELSQKGAYLPQWVYSPRDVSDLIQYGQSRGVRIIPEIDMPAHTDSIALSHPELIACHGLWWGTYAAEPPAGQLNVVHPGTMELVRDVIQDVTSQFPDSFYHAGGDEINPKCWPTNQEMSDYVKKHNITFEDLWNNFTDHSIEYVTKQNKRPMLWEDSVHSKADKKAVVQTWVSPPWKFTEAGHDVVISNYDYFYLDCGKGGWVGNDTRYISPTQVETPKDTFNYGGVGGSWCAPFKTWQRIYTYDMTFNITEKSHVLGGEVALWSEQSGPTVLDARLWPRSAAAAEIYWSGSYDSHGARRTLGEVQPRFNDWTLRLMSRGIDAEPNTSRWCLLHPNQCNLEENK